MIKTILWYMFSFVVAFSAVAYFYDMNTSTNTNTTTSTHKQAPVAPRDNFNRPKFNN